MANRTQLIDSCVQVASKIEAQVIAHRATRPTAAGAGPTPPQLQVPPAMPPAGGPRRKAVIVGINYFGTSAQLRGCINDAR